MRVQLENLHCVLPKCRASAELHATLRNAVPLVLSGTAQHHEPCTWFRGNEEIASGHHDVFYMDNDVFPLQGYEHSSGNTHIVLYTDPNIAHVTFTVNYVCRVQATWKYV